MPRTTKALLNHGKIKSFLRDYYSIVENEMIQYLLSVDGKEIFRSLDEIKNPVERVLFYLNVSEAITSEEYELYNKALTTHEA